MEAGFLHRTPWPLQFTSQAPAEQDPFPIGAYISLAVDFKEIWVQ